MERQFHSPWNKMQPEKEIHLNTKLFLKSHLVHIHICILNPFAAQWKLTQHCKATILQSVFFLLHSEKQLSDFSFQFWSQCLLRAKEGSPSAPEKTERDVTETHRTENLCVLLMPSRVQLTPLLLCETWFLSFCLPPILLGSSGETPLRDPPCCKSWAQGLWVLSQIAVTSCPQSYPTAEALWRATQSNRHAFHMALGLARLAGPPVGVGPSVLCPPVCRPSSPSTFPVQVSVILLLAPSTAVWQRRAADAASGPPCAWQQHPTDPEGSWKRLSLLNKKRVNQRLLGMRYNLCLERSEDWDSFKHHLEVNWLSDFLPQSISPAHF